MQGQRPLCGHQRQPPGPGRLDPQHQGLKRIEKGAEGVAQVFGGEGIDLCGKGGLRLFPEKKQILQNPKPRKTGFNQAQPCGRSDVGRFSGCQIGDKLTQQIALAAQKNLGQQSLNRKTRRQSEQPQRTCPIQRVCQQGAGPGDFVCQLVQRLAGEQTGQVCKGIRCQMICHFLDNLGAQQLCRAVIHLGELWGHARFQRKAPQKRGAEGMDRLNPQPARRFYGAREQAPRLQQGVRSDRAIHAKLAQRGAQVHFIQHRPAAQPPEQAVLHLGCGGLGIGQAQNALRLDPVQQEPRHPVGQDAGLARSGIRRQPCRGCGIGRLYLPFACGIARHPTSSGTGLSVMSHSPNRAR